MSRQAKLSQRRRWTGTYGGADSGVGGVDTPAEFLAPACVLVSFFEQLVGQGVELALERAQLLAPREVALVVDLWVQRVEAARPAGLHDRERGVVQMLTRTVQRGN